MRSPTLPPLFRGLAALLLPLMSTLPSSSAVDATPPFLDPAAAPVPITARQPKTVGMHGDKLEDPFFWLRDKKSPAVLAHLKAENAYTAAVMAPLKGFEDALYREMLSRVKQTDVSAPYLQRGYWIYSRTEEGKQYPILCRKQGKLDAPEEIVLDVNRLAEGQKFMSLAAFEYSDDNTMLAYATDVNGHRDYDFHLLKLATREEIKTPIGKVADISWAADNRTIFFATEDEAKRSDKLWRYTLGERAPVELMHEKDELFGVSVDRSHDGKLLLLGSASSRTTEWSFVPADKPDTRPVLITPRRDEIEYYPEHREGVLYIRTNDGAKEFRVMTAPAATPDLTHWEEYLPSRPGIKIEGFEPFAKYAVVSEREAGLPQFSVLDFADRKSVRVPMPEPAYDAGGDANPEFDAPAFRYSYESPVTPRSVYEYDFAGGKQTLLKRTEVLGGYDPARFVVERVSVPAADGTQIPLDIVRRRDVPLDGTAPGWMYGYGSYGISQDASFSSTRVSLLERGVVYAIAHVRGGGELGEAWHEGGRMMTKKNTFSDFAACGDYLVQQHYTSHERLVIQGGSAGGLLVGATLNLRPDLCSGALMQVPFVDVLNTMSDATLPLTTGEYIEWGNPNKKDEYDYIKSYSPYDNLAAKNYPAILLMTSLNDSQVPYWEPAKYAAKLRTLKTDKNVLLLKINLDAGHGGASGRYDALKETAFADTFGLAVLGLAK